MPSQGGGVATPIALSPRSEVERLRAVLAVKDACLLNFSKTLRAADDRARTREESLLRDIDELKGRVGAHSITPGALSKAEGENRTLRTALEAEKVAQIKVHTTLENLRNQHDELLAKHDELLDKNNRLVSDYGAIGTAHTTLKEEYESLRGAHENLLSERDTLQTENRQMQLELKEAREVTRAEREGDAQAGKQLSRLEERMQNDVDRADRENFTLRASLAEARAAATRAETDAAQVREKLENQRRASELEAEEAAEAQRRLEARVAEWEARAFESEAQVMDAERRAEDADRRAASAEARGDTEDGALEDERARTEAARAAERKAREAATDAERRAVDAEQDARHVRGELVDVREQLRHAEESRAGTGVNRLLDVEGAAALREELEAARTEREEQCVAVEALEAQLREAEEKSRHAQQRAAATEELLEQAEGRLVEARAALGAEAQLKARVAELEKREKEKEKESLAKDVRIDEVAHLRAELRTKVATIEEGKRDMVEILKDLARKDQQLRALRAQLPAAPAPSPTPSAGSEQVHPLLADGGQAPLYAFRAGEEQQQPGGVSGSSRQQLASTHDLIGGIQDGPAASGPASLYVTPPPSTAAPSAGAGGGLASPRAGAGGVDPGTAGSWFSPAGKGKRDGTGGDGGALRVRA